MKIIVALACIIAVAHAGFLHNPSSVVVVRNAPVVHTVRTIPVETIHVRTVPVQTIHVRTVPVETVHVRTVPVETVKVETVHTVPHTITKLIATDFLKKH